MPNACDSRKVRLEESYSFNGPYIFECYLFALPPNQEEKTPSIEELYRQLGKRLQFKGAYGQVCLNRPVLT
jgi:hypothetical protein